MIVLFWIINFAISWFNAWAVGKSWNETKHAGGFAHLLNWCGAIMSAAGFTWCYLVIMAVGGSMIQTGEGENLGPMISQEALMAMFNLGFMIIYPAIIGTGIIITIDAWASFRRSRSFADGALATYDTFAMIYNISQGVEHLPGMFRQVSKFFSSDDDDVKSKVQGIVLVLVALALVGGVLTTRAILRKSAHAVRQDMAWKLDDSRRSARS